MVVNHITGNESAQFVVPVFDQSLRHSWHWIDAVVYWASANNNLLINLYFSHKTNFTLVHTRFNFPYTHPLEDMQQATFVPKSLKKLKCNNLWQKWNFGGLLFLMQLWRQVCFNGYYFPSLTFCYIKCLNRTLAPWTDVLTRICRLMVKKFQNFFTFFCICVRSEI